MTLEVGMVPYLRLLAALAAVFALSACSGVWAAPELAMRDPQVLRDCQATTFTLNHDGKEVTAAVADAKGNLTLDYYEYVGRDLDNIDLLLDCGLGQAPTAKLKLLRGHILVALAAKYAQFNVTGRVGPSVNIGFKSYDGMEDDAAAVLTHVYNSELGMRYGLAQLTDATVLPSPTPDVDRIVERILPVAVLALKSEAPSLNRGRTLVATALTVAAGDVTDLRDAGQVVAGAVGKVMVLNTLGVAYFKDARLSLAVASHCGTVAACDAWRAGLAQPLDPGSAKLVTMAGGDGDKLFTLVWRQWEGKLNQACSALASFAGTQPRCVPTEAEAAQGFQG